MRGGRKGAGGGRRGEGGGRNGREEGEGRKKERKGKRGKFCALQEGRRETRRLEGEVRGLKGVERPTPCPPHLKWDEPKHGCQYQF